MGFLLVRFHGGKARIERGAFIDLVNDQRADALQGAQMRQRFKVYVRIIFLFLLNIFLSFSIILVSNRVM